MTASKEQRRYQPNSPDALSRSRGAHRAALLFAAASKKDTGFPASGALIAIHVSLAYRHGEFDASLTEMGLWLRGDRTKLDNLIKLGRIQHEQAGMKPVTTMESKTPGLIRDVFMLAQDLLIVPEAELLPFYSRYESILQDLRKPEYERNDLEIATRNELRRLGISHLARKLASDE